MVLAVGPACVVLLFGALVYDGVRRTARVRATVAHTRNVIEQTWATLSTLQDAETGQRGYVITGAPRYLEPYDRAVAKLQVHLDSLRRLMRDEPVQQRRLDTLNMLAASKMTELAQTIAARRTQGFSAAAAIVDTDHGRRAMDSIRTILTSVGADESGRLHDFSADEARHARLVRLLLLVGTLATVAVELVLNALLYRQAESEARAARQIENQRDQLQSLTVELEMQAQQLQDQAAELETGTEELQRARDDAERGRAAAETANRAKTEFLSVMSHELRTPLNAIAGHAQLVEMGIHGPVTDGQRDALQRVQRSQVHLLGLIDGLLNLTRIEEGRLEFDVTVVPLRQLLADVNPMVAPLLAARRIELVVDIPEDCAVMADREKTQQILINLLGNAAKFTPEGGKVTVSCGTRAGAPTDVIFLRVADTGIGIPRDRQEWIFQPFTQVDRANVAGSQRGVGLGLAIARDLAHGMGGDLRVRSEVGKGSVFTLTLRKA